MESTTPPPDTANDLQPSGGQGDFAPLSDPHRIESDCAMLRRAVRERWGVPHDKRGTVVTRLVDIVRKTSVLIPVKDGVFDSEAVADANAVAASRVIVAMVAQEQADEHLADKNARIDGGQATESVKLYASAAPTEAV